MSLARKLCSTSVLYFLCGCLTVILFIVAFKPTHVGLEDHELSQQFSELASSCPSCSTVCERQAKLYKLKDCGDVLDEVVDCERMCPGMGFKDRMALVGKGGSKLRKIGSENIPPELLEEWDPDEDDIPTQRLPRALIIGFSRTGTAALKRFLALHSDTAILDWDISYFCDVHYYMYTMTWYRKMMPYTFSGQMTLEKSPCYIQEKQALERIKAFNSSVKLIVALRNPISRIISLYGQMKEKYSQFGTRMKPIEEFLITPEGALNTEFIQKAGVYAPKMVELFKLFPRKQIHIVDGEELIVDPLSEMEKLEEFLGLKPYLKEDDFVFNKTKGFYCWRIRKSGQKDCLSPNKGHKHPALSENLLQTLQLYLKPFNEALFKTIGRTFEWDQYE